MRQAILPLALCLIVVTANSSLSGDKPNLLIITVDDMNCDSVGVYGSSLDATPNMDGFAKTALRFQYAHVQVGNCMPSRNVMWSGRYPHNNRVEGFYQVKDASYPVLCDLAQDAGYFTAIRHKIGHSTPFSPYHWDLELDNYPQGTRNHVKDAESYGASTTAAITAAKEAGKPFCALINISDPHKPFYTQVKQGKDPHVPSKVFGPDDFPVPGFLHDDPVIRSELALYYSSVRRADDGVGHILSALDASGHADDTVVFFLSDHGMPLPFAKTQLYHHSTRTPLMVRWPGNTRANSIDNTHMVSAVDFVPTLMEIIEHETPKDVDGRSFASLLQGESQAGRDSVFKVYNENSGAKRNPMRGIETREYLYLFNPWSDGQLTMATATNGTATYKRMQQLAADNPVVAARVELMTHRVVEELYHVASDPDCLVNLIDSPKYQQKADELRAQLLQHMQQSRDPIAPVFQDRNSKDSMAAYMARVQAEADARRANRRKAARQPKSASNARNSKTLKLIQWQDAELNDSRTQLTVRIAHRLSQEQGRQPVFATLKRGNKQRIERIERAIEGRGVLTITFELPSNVDIEEMQVAAFVGKNYETSWQHINTPVAKLTGN